MPRSELSQLSQGITTLKRMTKTLLPSRKKHRGSRKSKAAKKTKKARKTRGKKGRKSRRHLQRGGSTFSYEMPGRALGPSESMLASPAPLIASNGHTLYDVHGAKP
jgi:hypothetical protein